MGKCLECGARGRLVSDRIGFCAACIRTRFPAVWPEIRKVHEASRKRFNLPLEAPRTFGGVRCGLCLHDCRMGEGDVGYCGLRRVQRKRIVGGRPHEGNLSFVHDPLPTNCVAGSVCAGGTGCGYPEYAQRPGPERGYANLAVSYHACGFNCLYCQNHHFKLHTPSPGRISASELAGAVDERTSCICYFGGDPAPQILHAVKTSRLARKRTSNRIMRICWETNGSVDPKYLRWIYELSLASGGCIKFDLKAWSGSIHYALCGVSNRRTLENFRILGERHQQRREPPLLTASTLLVPGYVDSLEIREIARFIASLDPDIPYILLAFFPSFELDDLPVTDREQAERCREVALRSGLRNVRLENEHLLR